MSIAELRAEYHRRICTEIIRISARGARGQNVAVSYPNFADGSSGASSRIAWGIVERLGCTGKGQAITGQTAGRLFEQATRDYIEKAFGLLCHLRPGKWLYSTQSPISEFDQYEHLSGLASIVARKRELASALGTDYIIAPDIVVCREPVSDDTVNQRGISRCSEGYCQADTSSGSQFRGAAPHSACQHLLQMDSLK